MTDPALTQDVVDACLAMGFACAGVAPARATEFRQELLDWLAAGKHGEMAYLTELLDERLDVGVMLPGARAVIVVADRYAAGGESEPEPDVEPRGRIARYARGEDYHRVIKRRLHVLADRLRKRHPGAEFRSFVDTGPVLEREHAARAGLGFIGKHTLLISPEQGSYLLLGGIATTLELAATGEGVMPESRCGTCTRCIDACPTGAISSWSVDASRCISYLTLEHAGPVSDELAAKTGEWLIGCDVCQEVCPYNARAVHGGHARVNAVYGAGAGGPGVNLPILDVLGWDEAARSRVMSRSAAKRATLEMLKRSAVIVAGNMYRRTGDGRLVEAIRRVTGDEREVAVVREAAGRVLRLVESPHTPH